MKVVPQDQLVRLTPKISWTAAGLIQPLAIAIQMARQAELRAHQNIMIFGAGCIGVQLGAMAKAYISHPILPSFLPSLLPSVFPSYLPPL